MENPLDEEIWDRLKGIRASATLHSYQQEWEQFWDWCLRQGAAALPASESAVCAYLRAEAAQFAVSTVHRKIAAITCAHRIAGIPQSFYSPGVKAVLDEIRLARRIGRAGPLPLNADDIAAMVAHLPPNLLGARDRCLILLGHASALRRSELIALDRGDVAESDAGLIVASQRIWGGQPRLRRIAISEHPDLALCPVRSYRSWITQAGIESGPLFRWVSRYGNLGRERLSDKSVALVVKRALAASGRDPAAFSTRSLSGGR